MMEKEAKRHMPSGVVKKIRFVKDPNGPSKKYLLFSCEYQSLLHGDLEKQYDSFPKNQSRTVDPGNRLLLVYFAPK